MGAKSNETVLPLPAGRDTDPALLPKEGSIRGHFPLSLSSLNINLMQKGARAHDPLDRLHPTNPSLTPMITLTAAIDRYLIHLRAERNLAPRTIDAYRYDLERLARWLRPDPTAPPIALERIDTWRIKDYLAHLREDSSLKPTTLSRTISSLKGFWRWAVVEGLVDTNPASPLRSPKKPRRLPIHLAAPEVRNLADALPPEGKDRLRDRTIMLVLVMTGMRLAELVGLDVDTVDLESGFLRVMGKGRKERLIPINSAARQLLHRWLAERPAPLPGCRALFLSRGGQRISRRTVQYLVRRAVKRAGLDPRISPHKLRHTFATHLYAEGTDLRDIQELLGHANIASTSIYTHTNVDRLRHAIRSLSDGIAD